MIRGVLIVLLLLAVALAPLSTVKEGVRVGSKKFTESVILGEMLAMLSEEAGPRATHYRELGGTKLVFEALAGGEIDLYPEYTGTIREEILSGEEIGSLDEMRAALRKRGVLMSEPLGFNNTYVLGLLQERAEELGVERVSDLTRHPELRLGFSNEFLDREDGWRNLRDHYGLPQRDVQGMDHDLSYRQLKMDAIDVIAAYATDAKIGEYGVKLLEDDRGYFPEYDSVVLYRSDLGERFPGVVESVKRLEGAVSVEEMMRCNGRVENAEAGESVVAVEYLAGEFGFTRSVAEDTLRDRLVRRTLEHLDLVRRSLIPAILLGVPLGVLAAKLPAVGQVVLAAVGVVQTIPSLALLVMLMPLVAWLDLRSIGLGSTTAVLALLLYSLLPIVRNTHAGLAGIPAEHRETAAALGLPYWFRLMRVELPLASRSILAGIKTAAVLNVGFATLGALIGAGGYGQPILTGIRLTDTGLILEGALPAAALALLVQWGFDWSERLFVPRGLRLPAGDTA